MVGKNHSLHILSLLNTLSNDSKTVFRDNLYYQEQFFLLENHSFNLG